MIISISGKIGSGKDTIGKIIQYLHVESLYRTKLEFSCEEYLKNNNLTYLESAFINDIEYTVGFKTDWKIKKFADKLKEIVCLLIGCNKEQLEDRDFKEKELGPEWWYWRYETEPNQYVLFDYYSEEAENMKDFYELIKTTPRLLLQLLGTEAGREIIHPNIWVNALFNDYKSSSTGKFEFIGYPKWIITDMRFPNELKAVKDRKGITIRVNRDFEIVPDTNNKPMKVKKSFFNIHKSEVALDDYQDWDYVIDNNGTIEELIGKVKKILVKEEII